ncbi:hypothetical protein [Maridesulfovibrio bastinii]|uniref:hypothetical protein n=1 Tax=Maridesulfovibrio bastinii TaxID=47157 RepID=UPI00068900F9|nr:hypothetical protein [Maridesulfovibrio bastinii]
MLNFTHTELTIRAERWLVNSVGCNFAFRELGSFSSEIPDSIGWRDGWVSHLVECKTSRSDFLTDRKKWFRRRPEMGMGMYRYMLCPKDLIKPDEVPESWGLLYCLPKIIKKIKKPISQTRNINAEMTLLTSALRRVHIRGDLQKIYDMTAIAEAVNE